MAPASRRESFHSIKLGLSGSKRVLKGRLSFIRAYVLINENPKLPEERIYCCPNLYVHVYL